ncbi:MAG: uroporphyrinogen-III C-methyltransferase [Acidimicrobiaceae bacterium]|nr:uroporphyrinogen-III C-methyltransferase [Acidimicrobiaceae bacterium]
MSVYLVGAGPGDADLLTVRAVEILGRADVVVHDRLVGDDVLKLIRPRAARIDVGKKPGASSSQSGINELLIELAGRYDTVVRLKGGDPFIFGRGGEEAVALSRCGIEVHVVPGISSAFAAPLLAGITVTHRGASQGVCVVTATAEGGSAVDFEPLALANITLVVLMGVAQRSTISSQLRRGGLDPSTAVAVVESASRVGQRVTRARLDELATLDVYAPAVIVVGPVAALDLGVVTQLGDLVGAS